MEDLHGKIEMDYQNMIQKAARLEELSRQLKIILDNDLGGIQKNVRSAWKGSSGELYQQKLNKLTANIQSQINALNQNARGIRTAAEKMKRVEQAALARFKK